MKDHMTTSSDIFIVVDHRNVPDGTCHFHVTVNEEIVMEGFTPIDDAFMNIDMMIRAIVTTKKSSLN